MGIPYLSNSRAMWGTELSTALHAALARMEALSPPAKSEYGRKGSLYTNTNKETKTAVAS